MMNDTSIHTSEHMQIMIYVGDPTRGRMLQMAGDQYGWSVLLPTEMLEALGMYVVYFPDLVIIDTATNYALAEGVFTHLRSVDAQGLLVLADTAESGPWNMLLPPTVQVVPPPISHDRFVEMLIDWTNQRDSMLPLYTGTCH